MDDKEIIELFHEQKRREKAFRMLVDKYKEKLYWHIRRLVIDHEDADDVLQNTFVKIWRGLCDFRYDSQLYTWMYRIATNEAITFLSEKKKKVFGNSEEMTEALANRLEDDVWFDGDKIQAELQKAILMLTDRQRAIFNMRYYDEMSYEDISVALGVAIGTLKATYHNAVKKIEQQLSLDNI